MTSDRHFRNTSWGMEMSEVKAVENNATYLFEDDSVLAYEGNLVGCDAKIYYSFENNKLMRGAYSIDNVDDVRDIKAYEKLLALITKKYGDPVEMGIDQKYPEKKLLLGTYGVLADTVASGNATLKAIWRTRESIIRLHCLEDREKYNAVVGVIYIDVNDWDGDDSSSYDEDMNNI